MLLFSALVLVLVQAKPVSYEDIAGITVLTAKEFDKEVKKPNQLYVVQFYKTNDAARKINREFLQSVPHLAGHAKIGVVSCEPKGPNKAFCKENGFTADPIIKLYKGVELRGDYVGELKSKDLASFVKDLVSEEESGITKLDNDNYKQWLAANEKLPKAVYYIAKKQTVPLWKTMAYQLKGRMAFAIVSRGDRKVARHFGGKEYPGIGVVQVTESYGDDDDDDDAEGLEPIMYEGKINAAAVRAWLEGYALEADEEDDEGAGAEPIELEQLTDDSCLDVFCNKASGLCAILVISVNPEASAREKRKMKQELSVWKQTESLQKSGLVTFVWMDGVSQIDFLDKAFRMIPQDYPQVVIFSGSRKRFVSFVGSYASDSISDFLDKVGKATVQTIPIHSASLPSLVGDGARCEHMRAKKTVTKEEPKGKPKFEKIKDADGTEKVVIQVKPRGHRGKKGIVKLDSKNVKSKMENSAANWMIGFSHTAEQCADCKQFKKAWKVAGDALENFVKFGWVDCEAEGSADLCSLYDVTTFPTVKVLRFGSKEEQEPTLYDGEMTGEALTEYARSLLRDGSDSVQKVAASSMQKFLSDIPLAPKFMYVSDSDEESPPDLMRALSLEYREDSDADIRLAYVTKKDAPEVLKALGGAKVDLPLFAIVTGEPTEPDASGMTRVAFKFQGIKAPNIDFAGCAESVDRLVTLWQYQKAAHEEKFGGQPQAVPHTQHEEL